MKNIYLICAHGDKRMPEALAGPNIHITAICCQKSLLRQSAFVDEVIEISPHKRCSNFIEDLIQNRALLDSIEGWVIFGRDDDLYDLARSDLPLELKLKLLPIHKVEAMMLPGSKSNFVEIAQKAGINIPKSLVLDTNMDFQAVQKTLQFPLMIKSDQGSGGTTVRKINTKKELQQDPLLVTWFPVVLQDFVTGSPRGVDALFKEGRLIGWTYCDSFEFITPLGPSISRRYVNPPSMDFEEELIAFGEATKAHGFANCSLFYSETKGEHLLFEVDLRTNAWHHLGPLFGLDWSELFFAPTEEMRSKSARQRILPDEGVDVLHWERYLAFALQDRKIRIIYSLLKMKKSERYAIPYKDRAIDRAININLIRMIPIALAKFAFELLPNRVQKRLKSNGATAKFASRVAAG